MSSLLRSFGGLDVAASDAGRTTFWLGMVGGVTGGCGASAAGEGTTVRWGAAAAILGTTTTSLETICSTTTGDEAFEDVELIELDESGWGAFLLTTVAGGVGFGRGVVTGSVLDFDFAVSFGGGLG